MDDREFQDKLTAFMVRNKFSISAVAQAMDVPPTTLQRLLSGSLPINRETADKIKAFVDTVP
jgi:plasmid maintenance system antidote protein VapI